MHGSSARGLRWPHFPPSPRRSVNPNPPKEVSQNEQEKPDSASTGTIEAGPGLPEDKRVWAGLNREQRARCRILAKDYGWTTSPISLAMATSVPSVSRMIRNQHKDTVALDEQYVDRGKLKKMVDAQKGVDWEERRKHRRKATKIGPPRKRAKVSKVAPAGPETCEDDDDEPSSAPPSRAASVAAPRSTLRPPPKRPEISPDIDESDQEVPWIQSEDHRPTEELVGPKPVLRPSHPAAVSPKDKNKNVWPPTSIQSPTPAPSPASRADAPAAPGPSTPRGPAGGADTPDTDTDGPAPGQLELTTFLASLEIDLSRHLALFLANDITCVTDLAQYCGFREANLERRMKEMFFDPFCRANGSLKRKRDAGFEWEDLGNVAMGGSLGDDCKGLKKAEIYALIHGIGILKRRRAVNSIPATKF